MNRQTTPDPFIGGAATDISANYDMRRRKHEDFAAFHPWKGSFAQSRVD
jgi:hypothetical protein